MRASLAARRRENPDAALPLLDARGARVILGAQPAAPVAPIAPSACSLFGPRGAFLAAPGGPLLVCDTGHHRLLVWNQVPDTDQAPADLVIGQPDFFSEGRNAKGDAGPATLNVPTGVAVCGSVLAVADAWNDRVLLWMEVPRTSNQPADVILGNGYLKWPYGVGFHGGRLYVADTGNRRVLVWDAIPRSSATPPDAVHAEGLRWPHAVAGAGDRLFIADAGAHRILGGAAPIGEDLSMPYGVALAGDRLVVADTANSRLLGFDRGGGRARSLAGQPTFNHKGDNRWAGVTRDSLCWPYAISVCGGTLVVADTGNNRVLLWDLA
jgi:hypothetical protein